MRTWGRGFARALLARGLPRTSGTVGGLPVRARVEVTRDAWGIPHIAAAAEHDLYVALGFVHAQDRLWQMESLRRFTEGRLSEIAGPKTVTADYHARVIGMPFMKREALAALSEEEMALLQAYSDGVNACRERRGVDLPLEFRSMGFVPEPWTPLDCLSLLPYVSWQLVFSPYAEKLFAVARGASFSLREWNDLFPVRPGAVLPPERFFDTLARLKLGGIHPATLLFYSAVPAKYRSADASSADAVSRFLAGAAGGGSNNWAAARGADGAPLLANDPHLGIALPPVWYFCHLRVAGGINAAGGSFAGCPGIVIGRNEHVAWGVTNVMLDAADILVFRVHPDDPTRYRIGHREARMTREDVVIGLPGGKSVSLPVYRTESGPVLTAVEKGVEGVAVLKWYGTLPAGAVQDHTYRGVFAFMRASTAKEILDAGRHWGYASQNLVAADDEGHIGWHVFGAAPARRGYSGRLPGDGTAGDDWTGFLPYDSLPQAYDPPQGWIATANNPPPGWSGPELGYTWAAPYRYDRICGALREMRSPRPEDFRALQADVHSLQADRIVPRILAFPLVDARAVEAARILASWDHEMTPDSRGAALYEVFLVQLSRVILGERLGDDLFLYLNARSYSLEDEIFDRPDSPLWLSARKGARTPAQAVEAALAAALEFCRQRMGRRSARWSWGRLHRYVFRHPGGTGPLQSFLLNRGPYPAPGDFGTVNVSWCLPANDSFDVTVLPSLRMISSLGDPDGLWIAGPLGQSGEPGHPHYDDMMKTYLEGAVFQVPLTPYGLSKVAKERLVLEP